MGEKGKRWQKRERRSVCINFVSYIIYTKRMLSKLDNLALYNGKCMLVCTIIKESQPFNGTSPPCDLCRREILQNNFFLKCMQLVKNFKNSYLHIFSITVKWDPIPILSIVSRWLYKGPVLSAFNNSTTRKLSLIEDKVYLLKCEVIYPSFTWRHGGSH